MRTSRAAFINDTDLLHGPLMGKIFAFVMPLVMTNLIQNLYNAADMVVVGLSGVDGAIGSIGTTAAMVSCMLNLFMGFAVGSSVMVARSIGERNQQKTQEAVHTSLIVGLVSGLVAMTLGLIAGRRVLILLGDQGHILELAHLYARIYFAGLPFIAMTNFLIAIFRAKGDTRTPLVILTLTGLLNVGLNLLFVLAFRMSVDGVALATTISNIASMIVLSAVLHRDKGWCRLEFRKLKVEKHALQGIVYNGLPAAIQGILFSLSNMLIQSSIISINNTRFPGGSAVIDGNSAGQSIESFAYVATNSVCQAAVTFTSQHYGAKKFRRMGKVIRDCYFASLTIAEVMAIIIIVLRYPLARIYLSSPEAIEVCSIRLIYMLTGYAFLAVMDTGSGIVRGLNRPITSTIVTLLGCCVLRVVWIFTIARANLSLGTVYISYPISWGITGLCHFIVAMTVKRKMMRRFPVEED